MNGTPTSNKPPTIAGAPTIESLHESSKVHETKLNAILHTLCAQFFFIVSIILYKL